MSGPEALMAALGIEESPAARAYASAQTVDELQQAAGNLLYLHATSMLEALGQSRGIVWSILRAMRRSRWLELARTESNHFSCCAVSDLCGVRELLLPRGYWTKSVQHFIRLVYISATIFYWRGRRIGEPEVVEFRDASTKAIIAFEDDRNLTVADQARVILDQLGLSKPDQRRYAEFLKLAVVQSTWLDPAALRQSLQRLGRAV